MAKETRGLFGLFSRRRRPSPVSPQAHAAEVQGVAFAVLPPAHLVNAQPGGAAVREPAVPTEPPVPAEPAVAFNGNR
jgi:hypothetical protein